MFREQWQQFYPFFFALLLLQVSLFRLISLLEFVVKEQHLHCYQALQHQHHRLNQLNLNLHYRGHPHHGALYPDLVLHHKLRTSLSFHSSRSLLSFSRLTLLPQSFRHELFLPAFSCLHQIAFGIISTLSLFALLTFSFLQSVSSLQLLLKVYS